MYRNVFTALVWLGVFSFCHICCGAETGASAFATSGTRTTAISYKRLEIRITSTSFDFQGGDAFAHLSELSISAVDGDSLSVGVDRLVGSFPDLEVLELDWQANEADSNMRMENALSRFIASCTRLSRISLRAVRRDRNYLAIPPPLDRKTYLNLRSLELCGFDLKDHVASVLNSHLESLELLRGDGHEPASLSPTDIHAIQSLNSLSSLSIGGYVKKSSDVGANGAMSRLRSLSIASCDIDAIPSTSTLRVLRFGHCNLTSDGIAAIGQCDCLEALAFHLVSVLEGDANPGRVHLPPSLKDMRITAVNLSDHMTSRLLNSVSRQVRTKVVALKCTRTDLALLRNVCVLELLCGCPAELIQGLGTLESLEEVTITVESDAARDLAPLFTIPHLRRLSLHYRGPAGRLYDGSGVPMAISSQVKEIVVNSLPDGAAMQWILSICPSLSKIVIRNTAIAEGELGQIKALPGRISVELELCSLTRRCLKEIVSGENISALTLDSNLWDDTAPSVVAIVSGVRSIRSLRLVDEAIEIEELGPLVRGGLISDFECRDVRVTPSDVSAISAAAFVIGNESGVMSKKPLHYFGK